MRYRNVTRSILALAFAAAVAAPLSAQEIGEIAEQFRRNGEALRDYSWKSKSEFQVDGEVRSTELFEVSFDDDGRISRELIETHGKRTKQQDIAEIDPEQHPGPDRRLRPHVARRFPQGFRGQPAVRYSR